MFNSFQVSDSDVKTIFCLIHHAINHFIWNDSELLSSAVDHHIKKIWQHCLLHCCFSFCILFDNSRIIENSIFLSQICCYQLSYYDFEQKQYNYWIKQIRWNLLCKLSDDRIMWNMIKYYKMILITSWLWFRYVHKNVKTDNIKALIAQLHKKKIAKL